MSSDWTHDHGSLQPGTWSIRCDVKGCGANLAPLGLSPTAPDTEQRLAVRLMAEANGWYVAQDRGVPNKSWDLCPEHAPPQGVKR
jgi:hypothetical protein